MNRQISTLQEEDFGHRILCLREKKVILDKDLATLYGVTTKRLNEQVKRNIDRFPDDFMFRLTNEEKQEVVANCDHLSSIKYSKTNPFAFSEHGAIMAANVLNSSQAIQVSVLVVKTFVKMRNVFLAQADVKQKLNKLEHRVDEHDDALKAIISAIQNMINEPNDKQKRPIGFVTSEN